MYPTDVEDRDAVAKWDFNGENNHPKDLELAPKKNKRFSSPPPKKHIAGFGNGNMKKQILSPPVFQPPTKDDKDKTRRGASPLLNSYCCHDATVQPLLLLRLLLHCAAAIAAPNIPCYRPLRRLTSTKPCRGVPR